MALSGADPEGPGGAEEGRRTKQDVIRYAPAFGPVVCWIAHLASGGGLHPKQPGVYVCGAYTLAALFARRSRDLVYFPAAAALTGAAFWRGDGVDGVVLGILGGFAGLGGLSGGFAFFLITLIGC